MRSNLVALIFGVLFTAVFAASARTITEDEAHAIGIDAYLHYSPITMDLTRLQSTNVEPGKVAFKGPMNIFVNAQAYPTADMRTVVRPNFDTLYSAAWLDLTKEPMVVSVPDTAKSRRPYLKATPHVWKEESPCSAVRCARRWRLLDQA
jgi:hypothetical protein